MSSSIHHSPSSPKHHAKSVAQTLVAAALAEEGGCIPLVLLGTHTSSWLTDMPTRNTSPQQHVATEAPDGHLWDCHIQTPPFVTLLLICMISSTRQGRNLYNLPPTRCLSIHISKNQAVPLEPASSMSLHRKTQPIPRLCHLRQCLEQVFTTKLKSLSIVGFNGGTDSYSMAMMHLHNASP